MGAGSILIVMRHAQAGELPGGPDAERALRGRGRRDAAAAGNWLRGHEFVPDAVICSTARRARQTWLHLSAELGTGIEVSNDPRLYDGGAGQILELIRQASPAVGTLMYIGHNPAAQRLVATLTGVRQEFPAGAIAVIELAGDWPDALPGSGTLTASWSPAAGGPG
ncbi:MAG TPA: histidine phosphatase family protein [Streptosporangiaceae bacterium]|jgi:phosphohistidine phosphatase